MRKITVEDLNVSGGMPKICVPLTGTTMEELLEESRAATESEADLVEWRVDFFEEALDADSVLAVLPKLKGKLGEMPLLFSFRTAEEGGEKAISNEQYIALNQAVIASDDVDVIDIEIFKGKTVVQELVTAAQEHQVVTIGSNHEFQHTPEMEELINRVYLAYQLGVDVPKLAVMPEEAKDVLTMLETSLSLKHRYPNRAMIMIAMGKLGMISRFSGEVFGSVLTFAALKNASAPGQVSVEKLKMILQLLHTAK